MHGMAPTAFGWMVTSLLVFGLAAGSGCGDDDASSCGDGILDEAEGEQCDDGNLIDGDGCSAECLNEAYCGNSIVEFGEECDDGNNRGGDGCNSICQREVGCGNGRLDYGEQCDDDNIIAGDGCSDQCVDEDGVAVCGNAILEVGEDCDDGNSTPGDGCDAQCAVESGCGDGVLDPGEECDDDNRTSGDGCTYNCLLEFVCGDGVCDTANVETCEKCPADCCPFCGDGVLDIWSVGEEDPPPYADETCDDGNNVNGDGCSAGCEDEDGVPTCGNSILETDEECDDGNVENGDACSAVCTWEFVCGDQLCDMANGETCRLCMEDCCPNCGDHIISAGDICDGNDLGGKTCEDFCYDGGTLACAPWCDFDLSGCTGPGPICGDNTAECSEQCDDSDLKGETCSSLGRDGGTLACNTDCTWNFDQCGALLWYLWEDFEDPTTHSSWNMGTGEWEIGQIGAGDDPPAAHSGLNAMATNLGGAYANNDTYPVDRAISPPINLTAAITPALRFFMWNDTETCCDGFAIFISTDNGGNWSHLDNPTPAYTDTVGSYDCWQEDYANPPTAWTQVDFDLTAYAGQTVLLGFSFYSDYSGTYTGPHVDDILVAEPGAMP